jgi:cysteine-rich repeat protein
MHRFAYFLSLPLALSTGCFNPSGGATMSDPSTSSDASSTSTTGSTTAPTSDPTTSTSTDATTQSATLSSTDSGTTLPGTTDLITTDFTSTTAITDTTDLTTLPDTTGVLSTCGDGEVDLGEECDDGNNLDDDGCSNDCKTPKCGDGVVHDGEECDDGNAENTDACVEGCKNATCGDDYEQAGVEECDDANIVEGDGCDPMCKLEGLSVFVTLDERTVLQANPSNADLHCNAVAKPHYPNRTFVAWVSTKELPIKGRLGMDKGRKYLLGKDPFAVLAENREQLLSGTLNVPINIDQNGNPVAVVAETDQCDGSPNYVWTGTNVDGTGTDVDCSDWTLSMVGTGTVGTISANDFKWTNKCARSCAESHRIICVQKEL